MWQKCPICNGTGVSDQSFSTNCTTCEGEKIISSLTGKPPRKEKKASKEEKKESNKIVEDFIEESEKFFNETEKFFAEADNMFSKMNKSASTFLNNIETLFKKSSDGK